MKRYLPTINLYDRGTGRFSDVISSQDDIAYILRKYYYMCLKTDSLYNCYVYSKRMHFCIGENDFCIRYKLAYLFRKNIMKIGHKVYSDDEYLYLLIKKEECKKESQKKVAEQFLNYNSVHLLYNGHPTKYKYYLKKLEDYKSAIQKNNFSKDDFVIVSSGILGLYGMREPTDIDMVTLEHAYQKICNKVIDCHHHVLNTYEITAEDLIRDPKNYVYWNGLKFAALDVIYRACNNRVENTKKIDGYFVRVIWGLENPTIIKLTIIRIKHYFIRTKREWKKEHLGFVNWKNKVVQKIKKCFFIHFLFLGRCKGYF